MGGTEEIENALKALHSEGRVRLLKLAETDLLVRDLVDFLNSASQSDRPSAAAAKMTLGRLKSLIAESGISEEDSLRKIAATNKKAAEELAVLLTKFKRSIHEMSSEAKSADLFLSMLKAAPEGGAAEQEAEKALNPEELARLMLSDEAPTLAVLYIPEPVNARVAAARYVNRLLLLKKRGFSRVNILTVFDEAQEFIPDKTRKEDYTEQASLAVEALLRHGRKYRAGCWLSTQRVAHLNVNALQQLHTYFAGTLPRYYDRMVIADAYSLDYEVVNRVAELDTGEWLSVSYKATKRKNVPVFLKAPNNEEVLRDYLKS